jgi:hypothetical protein
VRVCLCCRTSASGNGADTKIAHGTAYQASCRLGTKINKALSMTLGDESPLWCPTTLMRLGTDKPSRSQSIAARAPSPANCEANGSISTV